MKKYSYYILCIVTGILLVVGLRSASAAPAVTPPSGNVNPSFNQVYVADTLQSKTANVSGDLTVSGSTNLVGDTYAMGKLNAQGNIENPNGDVKINDGFNIDDEFYTGPNIAGITPVKGYYTILDRLFAYGVAVFKGSVTFQYNADVKGGLTVGGSAKATGKLSTDGDLIAGGKLGVTGDSVLNGTLKNSATTIKVYDATGVLKEQLTPAPVYIDDDMKVWGNLTSKGAFEAKGKALFSGDTEFSKTLLVPGGIENSAGDVLINDALDVRQGIFNNDGTSLVKLGSGSKPMNLNVTGKIKASGGIGTYSYPSATVSAKVGTAGIATTYCPSTADLLFGCYFSANDKDTKVYALDKTISAGKKGCYANFVNSVTSSTVTVSAVCFNPTN